MTWLLLLIPIVPFVFFYATHRWDRLEREAIAMCEVAFDEMQKRRDIYGSGDRMGYAFEVYNFDRLMMPLYRLSYRVVWLRFFGLKWKHLLTGKQQLLCGLYEPEEPPHLTYAMYVRKPWKVWDHPGFFHRVKITRFYTHRYRHRIPSDRVHYVGVGRWGGNSTSPEKLRPTGTCRPRKTS